MRLGDFLSGGRSSLAAIGAVLLVECVAGIVVGFFFGLEAAAGAVRLVWLSAAVVITVAFSKWSMAKDPRGRSYWWAVLGPLMVGLTPEGRVLPEGLVLIVVTVLMARAARRRVAVGERLDSDSRVV